MKIKNCRECPLRKESREQEGTVTYCNHPNHNREPYEERLAWKNLDKVAVWCPLKKGPYIVELEIEVEKNV